MVTQVTVFPPSNITRRTIHVRTSKRSKIAALAVGLSLIVAACGDDEETTDETTATEETEAPTEETEAPSDTEAPTDTEAPSGEAAMRVTYTLSDVAVWDDGTPISAADFQCTLDATLNTPGSISTTGYDQILSIAEGATPQEVVVEFASKYAPWRLLFGGLLKASATPDCNDVTAAFDGGIPYSANEWKIDSWSAEQLVLVPNEGYKGSRTPTHDRIVFVPAEDGATLLKSGAVDFIFPQAYTGLDQELADPNVDFEAAPSGAFEAFYFQSYDGPFADPVYRAAFSKSIDVDAVYAQIYEPFANGVPLLECGPIAPGPYCDPVFADTFDPEGAVAMLEEAGWTKDGEGFWVNPETGEVPEVRWMVNTGNTRRESTQEFLIPKLAEAGFKVTADNCEALPCVFETRLPSLDYDMAMYISTVAPDPAYLTSAFTCAQIPTEENDFQGQNNTGWCNEEASALLEQADQELDQDARAEEVKKAIALMAEDSVLLPLLQFPNVGAYRTDRVANATAEIANYRAINDWYRWEDVDGDGQIVVGAEQFPTADCPNPITECANSSWYVWLVSFPVLPGMYDTTAEQTIVPSEYLTGEAVLEEL